MMETGDRFRVNVFRQRGYTSLAARRVSRRVPGFKELHLDEKLMTRLCEAPQGLMIFAGITGCGKSTSIAAALDHINHTRRCHVVTIEDPIEYLFEDHTAFINQREIGTDCPTFDLALKHLMRQDPDVVLVGEMRDRDTCESVLRAAETGHLVFTTLHSSSTPGAITRLLDLFRPEEHPIIRQTLAANLVAVVCQNLVPSADPNVPRVPATEVLLSTPMVRKMIREGDESGLGNVLAADTAFGMHDFTWDLRAPGARGVGGPEGGVRGRPERRGAANGHQRHRGQAGDHSMRQRHPSPGLRPPSPPRGEGYHSAVGSPYPLRGGCGDPPALLFWLVVPRSAYGLCLPGPGGRCGRPATGGGREYRFPPS